MADITISEWVITLSDAYMVEWSNRGLFRRGKRLAEQHGGTGLNVEGGRITGDLDQHVQTITGPGFAYLACDCPATGTCYHLTAFLLVLRDKLKKDPGTIDTENKNEQAPWIFEQIGNLEKVLGKKNVSKALKMYLQSVPVKIQEDDTGIIATLLLTKEVTVRIPRTGGLPMSLCSCRTGNCSHKALAVLSLPENKGLVNLAEIQAGALTVFQKDVLDQTKQWVRSLVIKGTGHISRLEIDQCGALVTLTKQADLPEVSRRIKRIHRWLEQERIKNTQTAPHALRSLVADISATLTALQQKPLPQHIQDLAGVHLRNYTCIKKKPLIGVGAEKWETPTGFLGFTLHFFSPEDNRWYTRSEVRTSSYARENHWDPASVYQNDSWLDGYVYQNLIGKQFVLNHVWVSGDHRLSARSQTGIENPVCQANPEDITVYSDFSDCAQIYSDFFSKQLFAGNTTMPGVIRCKRSGQYRFDIHRQIWRQTVYDDSDRRVRLTMPHGKEINLEGEKDFLVFGHISQEEGILVMQPVSVCRKINAGWDSLTLPFK